MEFGILNDNKTRILFESINSRHFCQTCKSVRYKLNKVFDEKDKNGHNCHSNLVPGFSSVKIDNLVLIVGDGHGGKDNSDFRQQKTLDFEVKKHD